MDIKFIGEMINRISPSGREENLQKLLYSRYKTDFEEFTVDEQGNLTGVFNVGKNFSVMLAAHADEISLIVTGYNPDGTLQVEKNGGIRAGLYVGAKVKILTPDKIIFGAVGTNDELQKKSDVTAEDLFIDIGCDDKSEAEKLVPKGSYAVHDSSLAPLANGKYCARAFDDKIGVYIIFEAAKKARLLGADCAVYATATTGEETTGRGAYFAASKLKPDVCVTVDVTYATDYKGSGEPGDVNIGKGGVICLGSVPNGKLNEILKKCAEELSLPVQYEVFAGRTGTDSDTMLKTCEGIPQVLFSVPLRYMHSPVEVLSERDVDGMIEILAHFIAKLNENVNLLPYTLD